MFPNSLPALVLAAAASVILLWSAVSDVRRRIIPNVAVAALLAVFLAWAALVLGPGHPLISALEAGGIALAITFALYAFNVIGAGDSKLFAVAALFLGLGYLPLFALTTVLAGGLVALASLVLRPRRAAVLLAMGGKGDWGRGVPYGVAIAAGAAIVLWGAIGGYVEPYSFGKPAPVTARSLNRALSAPLPPAR
ncbi:MAG: A24 family peptidase [Caulobacteraceae bacterium]